jgi:hypothetical protein
MVNRSAFRSGMAPRLACAPRIDTVFDGDVRFET